MAINLVAIFVHTIIHMTNYRATPLLIAAYLFSATALFAQTEKEQPQFLETPASQNSEINKQKGAKSVSEDDGPAYVYETKTYDRDIHTVLVHKAGFQLNPPIISLEEQEQIEVRFDDLHPYSRTFAYTVEHCTHDWKPSDMVQSEYIDGFYTSYITDYSSSFNTLYLYTNHRFKLPNRDMLLKRSGNYLLKVYVDDNPDKVIFTHRFMVTESLVNISAKVVPPRNVSLRQEGQEVQFSVLHGGFDIANPYSDLHVKLYQNQRWNDGILDLKPVFVKNNELVYDYDAPATFMGGKEYRPLDLKSFRYAMEYIRTSQRTPEGHKIVLNPDEKRVFKQYRSLDDINGQFLIKNDDGYADHTESDYAEVFFSLAMDSPLLGMDVFIYGGFNEFQCTEKNKMTYNAKLRLYQGSLLLKQGFYNYMYAVKDRGAKKADITALEGTSQRTENEYAILVYYRDFSNNYDQLIGVSYVYAHER